MENIDISEFAKTILSPKMVAEALDGDWLAFQIVASDMLEIARLEAMTDAELAAEYDEFRAVSGWNEIEGKWEINEIGHRDMMLYWIHQLQEFRADKAAEARWIVAEAPAGLTHRPFAALAGAA